MKFPRPISEAEYERELNKAVRRFESAAARIPRKLDPNSKLGRVLRAFQDSPAPLTIKEAHDAAGVFGPAHRRGGHQGHLLSLGWIVRDGSKIKSWKAGRGAMLTRSVQTFRPADGQPLRIHNDDALGELLQKVEVLNQRRLATPCLASHTRAGIEHVPRLSPRLKLNIQEIEEIVNRRLAGEEFQPIAERFGVSRERVRQVFEEAFTRGRSIGR